jgi:hypothetical protein
MGFPTPWELWLSGRQLDDLENILFEPRSMERGFFRAESLKRIFAEHRTRKRDHSNRIWRLFNIEIWHRVMIDGEPAASVAARLASQPVAV